MFVVTIRDTADHDDEGEVVPAGTTGEICGEGFLGDDGRDYVAVDFGNIMCDIPTDDLKIVSVTPA